MTSGTAIDEVKGIMVDNVDKMVNNMERAEDLQKKPDELTSQQTTFHSRAKDLRKKQGKQKRNLWLAFCCFLPTCEFCCGTCMPE